MRLSLALLAAGQLRERQLRRDESGSRPWIALLVVALLAATSVTAGVAVLVGS